MGTSRGPVRRDEIAIVRLGREGSNSPKATKRLAAAVHRLLKSRERDEWRKIKSNTPERSCR